MLDRLRPYLFNPLSVMPLAYFRILFGGIMVWEVWDYLRYMEYGVDRVTRYYVDPTFFFTYPGFDWVSPLFGNGMYVLYFVLGCVSLCIMIGLFYRVATASFFLIFTYIFLIDQTYYMNHFYLVSLISFVMIFLPAHRVFSVDAWLNPELRRRKVPAWTLMFLRAQIAIPYIYGGIAKLNGDWLQGEPMRGWLSAMTDYPVIGRWFTEEWMVYGFSYGGLLLDLFCIPLLLWRRTRWMTVVALTLFHLSNSVMFNIGIFPWLMLGVIPVFFPPHWFDLWRRKSVDTKDETVGKNHSQQKSIVVLLGLYLGFQILFPLRHFLYPGHVSWTLEGHYFSWHMMLNDKRGTARFFVYNRQTGETGEICPQEYLTKVQAQRMKDRPGSILQFVHFLEDEVVQQRFEAEDIEIRVWSPLSLNGRHPQLMLDPTIDLTTVNESLLPADWILPLQQPLKGDPQPIGVLVQDGDQFRLVDDSRTDSFDWTLPSETCES